MLDGSYCLGLSPDGMGRGVGVGEAVDLAPASGAWWSRGWPVECFYLGRPVLTVGKSFKTASGEQAGYIGVAVSRT